MQMAFYLDQTRCMACNTCSVACKQWHDINPGSVRWRTQKTYELLTDDTVAVPESDDVSAMKFYSFVMSCNHCADPACQKACAAGAITKRDDGVVIVDRTKCIELKSCITACPFATPKIAGDKQEPVRKDEWATRHPMQKCNFCFDRLDKNEVPLCVDACPAYALEFGTVEEIMASHPEAVQLNKSDFPYAYTGTDTTTSPSFYIKKRTRAFAVTKAIPKV